MERNASISMSLLSHLPEDQGGFTHPIVSKSHEVCAVPSLVGLEFCALPILFAAFGFLPVSFVIVSFQHFVKASVVAWSLDFIC